MSPPGYDPAVARKVSAGLLLYRQRGAAVEVLIAHPGGPFFRNRDAGAWTVPKGEVESGEDLLAAAEREFCEETGFAAAADRSDYLPLGHVRQKSGKVVHAWAFAGDCDPSALSSNPCELVWPRNSGRLIRFPELDRAIFASPEEAVRLLNPAQVTFVERLLEALSRVL